MIKVACDYNIKEDIGFILESEKINNIEFAERAKVSRTTLEGIVKKGIARDDVCEKIYAYAYNNKSKLSLFFKNKHGLVSKFQLIPDVSPDFFHKPSIIRHYYLLL